MSTDLSITHLILNASPVVQFVIALLVFASLSSWSMIFDRMRVLKSAMKDADEFESRFWSGGDLAELYRQLERETDDESGMASVFRAGFREFARLRTKGHKDPMAMVQGAQRSMRVSLNREVDRLESHLSTLATIGSTSPYVGLFGTVWGIMNSFTALGNVKQATLALVAPGIAEALIATAIGLFAAIPAVIAYNRYSNDVERLNNRYDDFVEEFATILQRQAVS
ncbi:MAG: protein TolQ [Candidatus Thiodiazotropha lotti]|uniref:Tol-Pal system protein TolQ n=1 Tax=Candidatus Thiodiazotropha endoloripes TaxID=1818881 RepID=A0A1E2URP3_9GAMM|nr:protein TolQ [Candidatus Thiodiazotropha endoloripes]MCG7898470.1 protein TolQ [Candidatus Thiodiazotropha weberae]MCG7990287.1 protein TolQ [Candidatus Thiodiazotropha lotti]MCG7902705.1 protein TolQ [Candidatus Thiodiazotropha weberae]MCG7999076.1 protein TolQ [Candidatus Thiodiazotropha lotti]MCW4181941.1 protein TolQ [Candidatus Thiodiazotropha weberae]